MNNFKFFLLEDARQDSEKRKTAEHVFDRFIKKISVNPHESFNGINMINNNDISIGFDNKMAGHIYKDLDIRIGQLNNEARGHLFRPEEIDNSDNFELFLYVIDLKNKNINKIINDIKAIKETFIHEFIHYLDQKRYKGEGYRNVSYGDAPKRKDFANDMDYSIAREEFLDVYFKDDFEKNAYFQEFAYNVDDMLRTRDESEKRNILSNFKIFFKTVFPLFNSEMMMIYKKTQNLQYRQNLIKRVYKFWNFLKHDLKLNK